MNSASITCTFPPQCAISHKKLDGSVFGVSFEIIDQIATSSPLYYFALETRLIMESCIFAQSILESFLFLVHMRNAVFVWGNGT